MLLDGWTREFLYLGNGRSRKRRGEERQTIRLRPVKAFLRHGDRLGVKEETESAPKCRKYGGKTRASFVGKIV